MTRDADFKALIRARMAKTGESYATARDQLVAEGAESPDPTADASTPPQFRLGSDDARGDALRQLAAATETLIGHAGAAIASGELHVWYGEPAIFDLRVPLASITDARRVPDSAAGISLGVHGGRGKWLVNEARTGLVRLAIEPAVQAALHVSLGIPAEARERTPFWLRPLMRDRRPKVKQLTISVDDPDAFLAALRG